MRVVLLALSLATPALSQSPSPKLKPETAQDMAPRLKPETTHVVTPRIQGVAPVSTTPVPKESRRLDWESVCARYRDIPIPEGDEPTTELKDCSSEDLYFGIGVAQNPDLARQCAYQERKSGGPVYGGAGVLAMIYANGIGVKRNKDLALRFACEINGAPAEMEGRIKHLLSFEGNDFDLCQDITSGYMIGFCNAHEKKLTDVKRQERLQKVVKTVTGPDKVLLDKLQAASREFIEVRIRNEVDLSGTWAAARMINEETVLEEDFLQMLERYGQGNPNRYTAQDLISREKKMQAALTRIAQAKFDLTTVTPEKIAKTQKAWEGYRDAFAEFASKHHAGTPDYSVKAWLTAKRVHMLASFK
jgi:hypothetical protein